MALGGPWRSLASEGGKAQIGGTPQEHVMAIKIVAFVTAKPGEEDAFIAAARICVAASRAEPGVLHYDLWRETDGDRRFVFNELYADDAAVQAHMGSDHFKAFGLAARGLAAGRPEIIKTLAVDVAD
jgi:quinol monooxygenase YgiN